MFWIAVFATCAGILIIGYAIASNALGTLIASAIQIRHTWSKTSDIVVGACLKERDLFLFELTK
jgi:hypothetical protein